MASTCSSLCLMHDICLLDARVTCTPALCPSKFLKKISLLLCRFYSAGAERYYWCHSHYQPPWQILRLWEEFWVNGDHPWWAPMFARFLYNLYVFSLFVFILPITLSTACLMYVALEDSISQTTVVMTRDLEIWSAVVLMKTFGRLVTLPFSMIPQHLRWLTTNMTWS